MLSKIIRIQIEKRFGKEVRYPTDCEALAGHISMVTGQRVSTSTMKRVLGFVKGTREPRLYTLDVIAMYLGYANWDAYLEALTSTDNSEFLAVRQVEVRSLRKGDKVEFTYEPDRKVAMRYLGDFLFRVTGSANSKILVDDEVRILNMVLDYPLLVSSVTRGGSDMGPFKAGKVSGITSITINGQP